MIDSELLTTKEWNRPEPEFPTLEKWLRSVYQQAKSKAAEIIESKRDREYLMSGRFNDMDRNISRAIRNVKTRYGFEGVHFYRSDGERLDDVFLPMICVDLLVKEIVGAASAEYYYTYEKKWD